MNNKLLLREHYKKLEHLFRFLDDENNLESVSLLENLICILKQIEIKPENNSIIYNDMTIFEKVLFSIHYNQISLENGLLISRELIKHGFDVPKEALSIILPNTFLNKYLVNLVIFLVENGADINFSYKESSGTLQQYLLNNTPIRVLDNNGYITNYVKESDNRSVKISENALCYLIRKSLVTFYNYKTIFSLFKNIGMNFNEPDENGVNVAFALSNNYMFMQADPHLLKEVKLLVTEFKIDFNNYYFPLKNNFVLLENNLISEQDRIMLVSPLLVVLSTVHNKSSVEITKTLIDNIDLLRPFPGVTGSKKDEISGQIALLENFKVFNNNSFSKERFNLLKIHYESQYINKSLRSNEFESKSSLLNENALKKNKKKL